MRGRSGETETSVCECGSLYKAKDLAVSHGVSIFFVEVAMSVTQNFGGIVIPVPSSLM